MKLVKLQLENFKGIKNFALDTQGKDAIILGDNAAGKTTLFDAFLWLLFGKDSQNRTDFDIKTLDADGNVLHGLDHSVEATLDINGKQLSLRKVYSEKWTKQRGSATKTFTGHKTDHFIDGVPSTKKDFTTKIEEIADESIFKLLTNPMYFNQVLHWEERRRILLEVCGDISDKEVIDSDKTLAELPKILGDRSLISHKKLITARRTEINRELDKIPVRISEVQHGLPDVSQINESKLPGDIAKLKDQVNEKEQEKLRIQQGGAAAEKTKDLRTIEAEIIRVEGEHRREQSGKTTELQNKLYAVKNARMNLESDIKAIERNRNDAGTEIKEVSQKIEDLRKQWHEVNSQQFSFDQEDSCPTCGQFLPKAQVEAAREKALNDFNQAKAGKLETINAQGRKLKSQFNELDKQISELTRKLEESNKTLADVQKEESKLQAQVDKAQSEVEPITDNEEYNKLNKQKAQIESEIKELEAGNMESINLIQEAINSLQESISALEQSLTHVEQHKRGQERISQLKAEEKDLAKEYEKLEHELYLAEEFIRAKVQLLEEKINSKFDMARFKLFQQQVNGGLNEVCEMQYNGVPYSSLNNAARINVGLDVIKTLSEHYGFRAPIFVDNAEAVVELLPMDTQVIKLVVSGEDKQLRIKEVNR